MKLARTLSAAALAWPALCGTALAQDEKQAPVPFAGGQLTITEAADSGEKVLAFDGKELARNYDVFLDRIVKVDGVDVALVAVGGGGNQCGPAEAIVWKPEGGTVRSITVEQDNCGAPPAAVSEYAIYFVPYLMPGASRQALQWSPRDGLTTSGRLTYMPEPGTGWADVDPARYDNIVDAFHNEAVYHEAQKVLGDHLTDLATGLLVGGGTEKTASGAFYASGCVPHACGGSDAFMAVDPKNRALYFAQQGDKPRPDAWPDAGTWPADLRDAMTTALGAR